MRLSLKAARMLDLLRVIIIRGGIRHFINHMGIKKRVKYLQLLFCGIGNS